VTLLCTIISGTGKSALIKKMVIVINENLGPESVMLLVSTSIPALNMNGARIHSRFHKTLVMEDIRYTVTKKCKLKRNWRG